MFDAEGAEAPGCEPGIRGCESLRTLHPSLAERRCSCLLNRTILVRVQGGGPSPCGRNWQTRPPQKRVSERTCRFDSYHGDSCTASPLVVGTALIRRRSLVRFQGAAPTLRSSEDEQAASTRWTQVRILPGRLMAPWTNGKVTRLSTERSRVQPPSVLPLPPVAQWTEQWASNPRVARSNRAGGSIVVACVKERRQDHGGYA